MKFNNPYFDNTEKMELLQRWIIVQSILYYELDYSIVTDKVFDDNCKQLVKMMDKYPKSLKKTSYYYCMHDFDGATGFDLPSRLNEKDSDYLSQIASHLKRQFVEVGNAKANR